MFLGKLVTFEGLDGCGKSTQLEKAAAWLEKQGYSVLKTCQPGGTEIGEQIRDILLNPDFDNIKPESELLLYLADRIQHLHDLIIPAKERGKIILCDRFHDSTVAYQGFGRGMDLKSIESIISYCIKPYMPELTILLNISPETAKFRLQTPVRNAVKDRLDLESLSFFKRVHNGFNELAKKESERFTIINGEQEVEIIHHEIINTLRLSLIHI